MNRPTLAVVAYLNAKPLIQGLGDHFNLIEEVPARCWELVRSERADLGLIPAIGLGEDPALAVVPGIAIAAEGPVRSVVLVTSRPLNQVRSVAVDESSRAAAALLRILCARRFGISPRFASRPPDWKSMLAEHDAALLIGDPALSLADDDAFQARADLQLIDIGDEWTRWTGLPFVFAVWAGRPDRITPEIVGSLQSARDRGVARIEEIASEAATNTMQRARNVSYLKESIRYELGPRELEGLRRFIQLAGELDLVGGGRRGPATFTIAEVAAAEPLIDGR